MPRPRFRMLHTRSVVALVVLLAVGACGDRGNGRLQETAGGAAPDSGTVAPQRTDTAPPPVVRGDTVQGAASALKPPGTASVPHTTPVAERKEAAPESASAAPDTSAAEKPVSLDSLHPFMPVTITLQVPPPPMRPRVLRGVRAARHAGYERVVFQMDGDTLPGYRITYEERVVACGSGRRVSLSGKAALVVRLDPAQAHDDAGHATVEDRRQKPDFALLKEMALTCDYEGQVQWALGLDRRVPFRVLTLSDPARLVLDLEEGSP
jgi:hypothetical protein